MTTYQILGDYGTKEPFRPHRIRLVSGQSYTIRHPEMIDCDSIHANERRSQRSKRLHCRYS